MRPTCSRRRASRSSRWRGSTTSCRSRSCFDLPERLCQERNRDRPDRDFGPHVIRNQQRQLRAVAAQAQARRLPPRPRAAVARGGRGGRRSSGSRSGTTDSSEHGPFDIDRRRARLLRRARGAARPARLRASSSATATPDGGRSTRTRTAGRRCSSATSSTADRESSTASADRDEHGDARHRARACRATTT